MSIKLMAAEQ